MKKKRSLPKIFAGFSCSVAVLFSTISVNALGKDDIDFNKKLGGGGFGNVYQTYDENYVAKVLITYHREKGRDDDYTLLARLLGDDPANLRGVARPRSVIDTEEFGKICFIKKIHGNMLDYFPLRKIKKKEYCYAVATAFCSLARVHERGIRHADIKSDNIFYKNEKWFKLICGDLGSAQKIGTDVQTSYQIADIPSMAYVLQKLNLDKTEEADTTIQKVKAYLRVLRERNQRVSVYTAKDELIKIFEETGISLLTLEPAESKRSAHHIPLDLEMRRHSMNVEWREKLEKVSQDDFDTFMFWHEREWKKFHPEERNRRKKEFFSGRQIDFHNELDSLDKRFLKK